MIVGGGIRLSPLHRGIADSVDLGNGGGGHGTGLLANDCLIGLKTGEDGSHGGAFPVGKVGGDQTHGKQNHVVTHRARGAAAKQRFHLRHVFLRPAVPTQGRMPGGMDAALTGRPLHLLGVSNPKVGASAVHSPKLLEKIWKGPDRVHVGRVDNLAGVSRRDLP